MPTYTHLSKRPGHGQIKKMIWLEKYLWKLCFFTQFEQFRLATHTLCFLFSCYCLAVLYLREIMWVGTLFPLEERWLKIVYNQVNLKSLGRQNFKGGRGSKLVLSGENKRAWAWGVLVTPEDTTGTLEDECGVPGEYLRDWDGELELECSGFRMKGHRSFWLSKK